MTTNSPTSSFPGAVVFDTNAYRNFTFGRSLDECRKLVADLRAKEKAAGANAYAHPIVAWELFSHLADPADKALENCLNSLVAMGEHSAIPGGSGGTQMLADTYHTSTRNLFNLPEPRYEKAVQNMTTVITHIAKHAPDLSDPKLQSNIQHLSTKMGKMEQNWVRRMSALVDGYLPGAATVVFGGKTDKEALAKLHTFFGSQKFFEDWSIAYVLERAASINHAMTTVELSECAQIARANFATAFHLLRTLLQKLVMPKPIDLANPKKKRWNFIWDHMIAFSIGPGVVANQELFLITGDGEITDAAKEATVDSQVLTLEDYVARIGLPWTAITSRGKPTP